MGRGISAPDPLQGELFRPWRSERIYAIALVILACCFGLLCYLESTDILESQIALGVDPIEAAKWVALGIAAGLGLLAFWAIRLNRSLLAHGELRLSGSALILEKGASVVSKDVANLRRLTSYPAGANVGMSFPDARIRLPGQWLPPGWRRTWKAWSSPDGSAVRLRRKTHPLLISLRSRRPDVRPKLAGLAGELIAGLLAVALPGIGSFPLYSEVRRMANRPRVDDAALKDFQRGRYVQACEAYKRAWPGLRKDLYGSQNASEFLLYCGDTKSAVQAFVGFDTQPGWPFPLDPAALARIRISRGRYIQAEDLLRGRHSYLSYVALADQGHRTRAEEVLNEIAGRDRLARVLLLRHRGLQAEAREAADASCAAFRKHRPRTPSWLARVFESCILSEGATRALEDPRFEPAIRAMPGLRAELVRFTEREAPDFTEELKSVIQRLGLGNSHAD
jgi:hypothetical protein